MAAPTLIISGLTSLDEAELLEKLPETYVETHKTAVPEGSLAEPATITAIVTLGSVTIAGLTAWLAKPRRRKISSFTYKLRKPDGTLVNVEMLSDEQSEEAAKASILAQLGQWVASATSSTEK
jgi:hypothetical protein